MTDPQGTARDRLIEAGLPFMDTVDMAYALDRLLAHPADLLAVIAARGDLTVETETYISAAEWNRTYRSHSRYVSPWVDAPTSEETPT